MYKKPKMIGIKFNTMLSVGGLLWIAIQIYWFFVTPKIVCGENYDNSCYLEFNGEKNIIAKRDSRKYYRLTDKGWQLGRW